MEIRATGLSGPGTAPSSAVVGEGHAAFALALGVFGVPGAISGSAKAVPARGASSESKPLAGSQPLLAGLPSIESETLGLPNLSMDQYASVELLGTGAASPEVLPLIEGDPSLNAGTGPAAPSGEAEIGSGLLRATPLKMGDPLSVGASAHAAAAGEFELNLGLPQTAARDEAEALPVAPPASALPISLSSPVAPEAIDRPSMGEKASAAGSAIEADKQLTPKIPMAGILADGAVLQPKTSDASTADPAEEMEMAVPRSVPFDRLKPQPDDSFANLQIAPTAPINEVVRAPITASAQPVQMQPPKVEPGAAKERAAGNVQHNQAPAVEANANPNGIPDLATEQTAEPFTRMMQATSERAPLQPNAAPGPPPPVQPGGQAVATPLSAAGTVATPPAPPPRVEVPPMVTFQADKIAREMGIQIARRVAGGGDELVIRLDPAELGRINIRMSVNEQGQLRAIVAADAPAVVEAIRSDISELSRALEQAGVRTDSQSFRFDRGGNGDPGGQWQQRYQQQNSANRNGESSGLSMAEDEASYRPLAMNGRINMMA